MTLGQTCELGERERGKERLLLTRDIIKSIFSQTLFLLTPPTTAY